MIHGILRAGPGQVTPICLPRGRFREVVLFADNFRERLHDPVELRVALFDWETGWRVLSPLHLDGSKGPLTIVLEPAENIGGISVQRIANDYATVAWTAL